MAMLGKTSMVTIGFRTGDAIRVSPPALRTLAHNDPRVRVIEHSPTMCWIDSITGTVSVSLGDVLIYFPDLLNGQWLVLPIFSARFLLGNSQVDRIPTPVGTTVEGNTREEGGRQLTIGD